MPHLTRVWPPPELATRLVDAQMHIKIPKLSLVVLIGPSGSGKTMFARRHFKPTEILSSDACRGMVSDDENDQTVTNQAFEVLRFVAAKRLALGRLTVIDATNVQPEARKPLVELARQYHCLPVAIVLDLPEKLCLERNSHRADREFGPHVVRNQKSQLRRSLRGLQREGFRHVFVLDSPEEVEASSVERVPLWNDKRDEHGPFDIIGDVHGCGEELEALLARLGYVEARAGPRRSALGRPDLRPSRRPPGGLPGRPRRPRPPHPRGGPTRAEHGRAWLGLVCARQP